MSLGRRGSSGFRSRVITAARRALFSGSVWLYGRCRIRSVGSCPRLCVCGLFNTGSGVGCGGACAVGIADRRGRGSGNSRYLLEDMSLENSGRVINFSLSGDTEGICLACEKITGFCEDNGMNTKQTIRISLAMEEMMTMITKENSGSDINFDIRVFVLDDSTGIRIRYDGIDFDPLSFDDDDDKYMGIMMIKKLVRSTVYKRVLGLNTLIILL